MTEDMLRDCICIALENIAQDLHEIKEHTVKQCVAAEVAPGGWVSVVKRGLPPCDRGLDCSCTEDVLIGTEGVTVGSGRIFVIGWGYYSHACDRWYISCVEDFPRQYRPTRENVTHYLIVPKRSGA